MENTNSNFVIHFGKGEYAITNQNIDRLTKAVDHYNQTGEWRWSLQDCLGINQDGKLGKRFEEIKKSLSTVEDSAVQSLILAMSATVVRQPEEIKKSTRPSSVEREKRRTEVFGVLSTVGQFSDKEIERMVRSI